VETSSLMERGYDRRALMAAPHVVPCGLTLSHGSHPHRQELAGDG